MKKLLNTCRLLTASGSQLKFSSGYSNRAQSVRYAVTAGGKTGIYCSRFGFPFRKFKLGAVWEPTATQIRHILNANLTSTRQGNKKEDTDISFLEAPYGAANIFCEQYVISPVAKALGDGSGAPIGAHILNAPTADRKTEIHSAFSINTTFSMGQLIARLTLALTIFCFQPNVASQEVSLAISERLKEQLLLEIVPTLELREGGMCFFYPQGKDFVTKVAINCSRLFESFLEEIEQGKKSLLFEPEVFIRFKNEKNQITLLEILQSDFQIFSEIRSKEGGFASEKIGLVTVEIAKISQYFLNKSPENEQDVVLAFQNVIGRFAEDVVLMILSYNGEESVDKMAAGLWDKKLEFEKSKFDNQLLINIFLNIIKGTKETLGESAVELYQFFVERSSEIIENYRSYVPNFALDNFEYSEQVINLLEDCEFSPTNLKISRCDLRTLDIDLDLEVGIANRYYTDLNKWFSSLPANEILKVLNPNLLHFRTSPARAEFVGSTLKPALLKLTFNDQTKLERACLLLGESPCSLSLESRQKFNFLKSFFVFTLFALLASILYLILKLRPSSSEKVDTKEKIIDDLSAEERSNLRELRNYFNLKPFDNVSELHKSYRKMVFDVHPDKLRDGGKEFVTLQANYLKAKQYLDKLEEVREKKLSNS